MLVQWHHTKPFSSSLQSTLKKNVDFERTNLVCKIGRLQLLRAASWIMNTYEISVSSKRRWTLGRYRRMAQCRKQQKLFFRPADCYIVKTRLWLQPVWTTIKGRKKSIWSRNIWFLKQDLQWTYWYHFIDKPQKRRQLAREEIFILYLLSLTDGYTKLD